jgi:hypothetical protein
MEPQRYHMEWDKRPVVMAHPVHWMEFNTGEES